MLLRNFDDSNYPSRATGVDAGFVEALIFVHDRLDLVDSCSIGTSERGRVRTKYNAQPLWN